MHQLAHGLGKLRQTNVEILMLNFVAMETAMTDVTFIGLSPERRNPNAALVALFVELRYVWGRSRVVVNVVD